MMSSFALDRAVFGLSPVAMHAVSLSLHAALVVLCFVALRGAGAPLGVALGGAAIGGIHAVQAESVGWISARCEVLMAVSGIAALALFDRALRSANASSRRRNAIGAALALFLALAAKESAVAFAPLFVCLQRVRRSGFAAHESVALNAPWLLAIVAYAVLRTNALGGVSGGVLAPVAPLELIGAFGQGAARLLAPIALTIAPPAPEPAHLGIGAFVAAAGAVLLLHAWRRRWMSLLPIAIGLGFLAIAALGAARIGEVADRYLLLPAFAAGTLVTGFVEQSSGRSRTAGRALLAVAGIALAATANTHVRVFANDATLWSDAWAKNPRSVRAALNLGAVALDRSEPHEALVWLERAAALEPGDPQIEMNRAVAEQQLGDSTGARARLDAIVSTHPTYWPAALRAGHLALEAGDLRAAKERYEAVLRIHPLSAEAWAGLGVTSEREGRRDDARRAIEKSLALDPNAENAAALRALLDRISP
jgi:Flp pilus assembly protein TadD